MYTFRNVKYLIFTMILITCVFVAVKMSEVFFGVTTMMTGFV